MQAPTHPKRILFVCVENANRSQMAEAFARLHGGNRVEAYSAGSRPSGKVNARAVQFMREVGYDPTEHPDDEFRQVRDLIERKVRELLATLTTDGGAA